MRARVPRLAAAIAFVLLLALAPRAGAQELPAGGLLKTPFGEGLAARLVAEGFERARVEALLGDPRVGVVERTLSHAIVYREAPADYSRFLSEERLERARVFMKANRPLLEEAAARTGVPPEIVAAILMIESNFGAPLKTYPVFNVFVSLLWAAEPANFDTVRGIVQKRLPDVTAEKVRERAKTKARWAFEQLGFLLRIAARERVDLLALEGSWAGAFGLPQFIPSSFWTYAVDGDGNGRVELFDGADAVFSVGNYLKGSGWRSDLTEERKRAVIRRYNNSELYAGTVLAAAALLREPRREP